MNDSRPSSAVKIIECRRSRINTINDIEGVLHSHASATESLLTASGDSPSSSISTSVGIEWNDASLFVFFQGHFSSLRSATKSESGLLQRKTHRLWDISDVFEVFIGLRATERKMYKEFQVAPDGRWLDIDVWNCLEISNHHWYSGFRARSLVDIQQNIWKSVLDIPWNCFGADPHSNDEWNVNFYRASGTFHGDELLAWSPVGTGMKCFHRPEHFGRIKFLSE